MLAMPVLREAEFQLSLARDLARMGHVIYLHDAGTYSWPNRFNTNGLAADLLIETSVQWIHHPAMPVIAIEAKMGREDAVSDVLDGVEKLLALNREAPSYRAGGRILKPVFHLLTNPCLQKWDVATFWRTNQLSPSCCSTHTNAVLNTLLSRSKGALMGMGFQFFFSGYVNGTQYARMMSLDPRYKRRWVPNFKPDTSGIINSLKNATSS